MKIDLSNIKDIGSRKNIDRNISLPDISFRHQEIKTPSPFRLRLNIYNSSDSYIISGNLSGEVLLTCSRCLEKFNYEIDLKLDEEISKEKISDLNELDLSNLFLENILLMIPMKPVCSEACKGLCPQCGQNLNDEECGCEREVIDPRLEKLRSFFTDDE